MSDDKNNDNSNGHGSEDRPPRKDEAGHPGTEEFRDLPKPTRPGPAPGSE